MLKSYKYFYFIKLKSSLLNNKYIVFTKQKLQIKNTLLIKCNNILSIFKKTNLIQFINNNYFLIFFNNLETFNLIKSFKLYAISFSGFFINNNFLKNILYYYLFYTNNFKFYILMIFNFFFNLKLILFNIFSKLLVLLIK